MSDIMRKTALSVCLIMINLFMFGQAKGIRNYITGPDTTCEDHNFTYHVTPYPGAISYQWRTQGISVTFTPNPSYGTTVSAYFPTSNAPTGYIIVDVDTGSGYIQLDSLFIIVVKPIQNTAKPIGKTWFCAGSKEADSAIFSVAHIIINATSYGWFVPKGSTILAYLSPDSSKIAVRFDSSLNNSIGVWGKNKCWYDSTSTPPPPIDTLKITVFPSTVSKVTIIPNPLDKKICEGDQLSCIANMTNPGNFPRYYWQINGRYVGDTSNNHLLQVDTLTTSAKIVCVFKSNATCVSPLITTDTVDIVVDKKSVAAILNSPIYPICKNDKDSISITNHPGTTFFWSWQNIRDGRWQHFSDLYNSSTTIPILTSDSGDFQYRVGVINGKCKLDTAWSLLPLPVTVLTTVEKDTIIEKDSENKTGRSKTDLLLLCKKFGNDRSRYKIRWRYTDESRSFDLAADTAFDDKPFCLFKARDTSYIYYLRISYKKVKSCEDSLGFKLPSSLKDQGSSITIYPNPNNGSFDIEINSEYEGITDLTITDLLGNIRQKIKILKQLEIEKRFIHLDNLIKGVYLLEANFENGDRLIKKVLIY